MSAVRKVHVVTKGKKNNIPFFLVVCQSILAGITAHTSTFQNLPVLLSVLQAQVAALAAAQQQTKNRVPGAAQARDIARDNLAVSIEAIRAYLQGMCDLAPQQAETLVQAAGYKLAAAPVRAKPILAAKQGAQPGEVILFANGTLLTGTRKRGARSFSWAYSLDGKVWTAVPSTPFAKTTITGLTPLTAYQFRVALTDKSGQGPWNEIPPFLVH